MPDERIKINVSDEPLASRTRHGKATSHRWLLIGGGLLVLVLIGVGIIAFNRGDQPAPNELTNANMQATVESQTTTTDEPPTVETLPDDGQSLWASPTSGQPLDLAYLLPGTQLFLHVRIADILSHSEGDKVLAALGPWCDHVTSQLQQATGVNLSDIDTLLVGLRLDRVGNVDCCLRLQLNSGFSVDALRASGLQINTQPDGSAQYRAPVGRACYLTQREETYIIVSVPSNALPELLSAKGEAPLVARELQRVLQNTDASRDVTLVFAGKFLQIAGEKFLTGTAQSLRKGLVDFLGDDATATAISAHWDTNFFLELRSTVVLQERPHRFAALLQQRVRQVSDQAEDTILAQSLHPYGRKVLARFPEMLRKLGNYTRSGEDGDMSLLRTYLPITAGHNLLMASELLLNAPTGDVFTSTGTQPPSDGAGPTALVDRLARNTSLVFPKETLQKSLEILADDLGIPIEIAGRDLQLEGITKNQSFALDLRDRPGSEVLLAILLQANPDRTASGPADEKQKLVYVVREPSGEQPGAIVVTTRSAAQRRGEKLPEVFVSPGQ